MFFLSAVAAFLIDQTSKYIALSVLGGQELKAVGGLLYLSVVRNKGAAFGIFSGQTASIAIVSIFALTAVCMFYLTSRNRSGAFDAVLGVLIGASAGNLADRLIKGYVVDFIGVRHFSVMNLADIMINICAALLIISLIFAKEKR